MKASLKSVNQRIAHMGDIVLYKGAGYFYFIGDDVDFSDGVYVNRITELSLDQWIQEAESRVVGKTPSK
jgi:hypothetical protein